MYVMLVGSCTLTSVNHTFRLILYINLRAPTYLISMLLHTSATRCIKRGSITAKFGFFTQNLTRNILIPAFLYFTIFYVSMATVWSVLFIHLFLFSTIHFYFLIDIILRFLSFICILSSKQKYVPNSC